MKTGPATEPPPSASEETTAALLGAAKEDPMGQHEGGKDRQGAGALDRLEGEMGGEDGGGGGGGGGE